MKGKSLVSITDFTKQNYLEVLKLAQQFETSPEPDLFKNKVVGTLFFEPSTRTRLSFESAVTHMGGKIIGFTEPTTSSVTKGESLYDTIKTVSNYCEMIVMRHPLEGSARYASEVANVPIINAGDGANQHPTQTMLDLYSILKTQDTLEDLNICMVGDLKYGRTVHSLLMAMSEFNATFHFVSPAELKIPVVYKLFLENKGLHFHEHSHFDDIIKDADIIYMTRVQKERFSDPIEYEKTKNTFILRKDMLNNAKKNLKILHPLPRVKEIHTEIDKSPYAYYFTQALNGVYARQAIMAKIFGLK